MVLIIRTSISSWSIDWSGYIASMVPETSNSALFKEFTAYIYTNLECSFQ